MGTREPGPNAYGTLYCYIARACTSQSRTDRAIKSAEVRAPSVLVRRYTGGIEPVFSDSSRAGWDRDVERRVRGLALDIVQGREREERRTVDAADGRSEHVLSGVVVGLSAGLDGRRAGLAAGLHVAGGLDVAGLGHAVGRCCGGAAVAEMMTLVVDRLGRQDLDVGGGLGVLEGRRLRLVNRLEFLELVPVLVVQVVLVLVDEAARGADRGRGRGRVRAARQAAVTDAAVRRRRDLDAQLVVQALGVYQGRAIRACGRLQIQSGGGGLAPDRLVRECEQKPRNKPAPRVVVYAAVQTCCASIGK